MQPDLNVLLLLYIWTLESAEDIFLSLGSFIVNDFYDSEQRKQQQISQ